MNPSLLVLANLSAAAERAAQCAALLHFYHDPCWN